MLIFALLYSLIYAVFVNKSDLMPQAAISWVIFFKQEYVFVVVKVRASNHRKALCN